MLFNPINVENALKKERQYFQKNIDQDLLDEVNAILRESENQDLSILNRIQGNSSLTSKVDFPFEKEKVYSLLEIKSVCEKYRLRFLDSKYFKGEIPYEAISTIKHLEKKHQLKFNSFKIIAPAGLFKLEDAHQDPLLFASLGNGNYYLIHKWGNDLSWYRKILSYPLRNLYCFFTSVFILSAILSFLVPESWLNMPMGTLTLRIWLTVHLFIGFSGFLIFLGSTFQKNFSSNVWDSKFFN